MFFFDFGVSIYFFFFNLFLSGHGYSEAQMGLLTGTMAAGNLAGALPAARLIQRKGLRTALVACLIATPAVLCARSISPSFPLQIGLAFLTGLSLCMWAVCVSPMTAALTTERQRPLAFSLVFSLGIGVGALGALAGSRMPELFSHIVGNASALAPDQLTLIAACSIAALALIPASRLRSVGAMASPRRPQAFHARHAADSARRGDLGTGHRIVRPIRQCIPGNACSFALAQRGHGLLHFAALPGGRGSVRAARVPAARSSEWRVYDADRDRVLLHDAGADRTSDCRRHRPMLR